MGNRILVPDGRSLALPVEAQWLGESRSFRVYAGAADIEGSGLNVETSLGPALPLPPVHLRARRDGGDIALRWIRCSRADGDGWGAAESPLELVPERYRVTIFDGPTAVRTLESATPTLVYAAADQLGDFGAPPTTFTFSVVQLSPTLGAGHAATGAFHG